MERIEINAVKRGVGKGASRKLRTENKIPAVIYGAGNETQNLCVEMKEFEKAIGTDAGWNVLLDLTVDGKEKYLTRVADYQAHVLTRKITHVDFQILDLKKKIISEIPVRLVGEAKGTEDGGIVEISKRNLEVKCLPTNIPEHIDIDITSLEIGDSVHIEDISFPADVESLHDTNFSVVAVLAPKVEAVEAAPEEGTEAAIAEGGEAKEGEHKKADNADKKEESGKKE